MFNKKKKKSNDKKNGDRAGQDKPYVNMVSEGTEIIGTLKTESNIRIAGTIDGEAKVDGKVIIGPAGHVKGNIDAEDADIAGRVSGEVHVKGKLTLRQSSVVEGDLHAQSLIVEEGATFNGTCHMREYTAEEAEESEKTLNLESDDDTVAA